MKNIEIILSFLFLAIFACAQDATYQKIHQLNKEATKEYKNKNYIDAAKKFEQAHYIIKNEKNAFDPGFVYNAAMAYKLSGDCFVAGKLFLSLIEGNHTKPFVTRYGVDKKGEAFYLTEADYNKMIQNKSTLYKSYKVLTKKINEENVYESLSYCAYQQKNYEKALEYSTIGLTKFPSNSKLSKQKVALEKALNSIEDLSLTDEQLLEKYPDNPYYNYKVAVNQWDDKSKREQNIQLMEKAVKNDVKNPNAYIQVAYHYLIKDQFLIKKINSLLGASLENKQAREKILIERKSLYSEKIIPTLEKGLSFFPDDDRLNGILGKVKQNQSSID